MLNYSWIFLPIISIMLVGGCKETNVNSHLNSGIQKSVSEKESTSGSFSGKVEFVMNPVSIIINSTLSLQQFIRVKSELFDNSLSIVDVDNTSITTYSMGYIQRYNYKQNKVETRLVYDLKGRSRDLTEYPEKYLRFSDFYDGGQLWGAVDSRVNLMFLEMVNESDYFSYSLIPIDDVFDTEKQGRLKFKTFTNIDEDDADGFMSSGDNDSKRYYVNTYNKAKLDFTRISLNVIKVNISLNGINNSIILDLSNFQPAFTNLSRVNLIRVVDDIYFFVDYENKKNITFDRQQNQISDIDWDGVLYGLTSETSMNHIRTYWGDYTPILVIPNNGLIVYDSSLTHKVVFENNPWSQDSRDKYRKGFYDSMDFTYDHGLFGFHGVETKSLIDGFFLPYRKQSYPVELKYYDRISSAFSDIPLKVYACQTPYPIRLSLDGKYLAVPEQSDDGTFGCIVIYKVIQE